MALLEVTSRVPSYQVVVMDTKALEHELALVLALGLWYALSASVGKCRQSATCRQVPVSRWPRLLAKKGAFPSKFQSLVKQRSVWKDRGRVCWFADLRRAAELWWQCGSSLCPRRYAGSTAQSKKWETCAAPTLGLFGEARNSTVETSRATLVDNFCKVLSPESPPPCTCNSTSAYVHPTKRDWDVRPSPRSRTLSVGSGKRHATQRSQI